MLRYAVTLFLSAFLLFGVQPLAGKYSLPWFGGTPAVWTTCMLFFQAMLLGGYAYSYASSRWLAPKRQAQVHLALLGLTVVVLLGRALLVGSPVAPGPEWRPAADGISTTRLLAMLAATLGLPFFTLSTSAPLLQSWFSLMRPGASPYRLYALSNTASLLALLAYPVLVEPWLGRGVQAWVWGAGFLLFAAGGAVCAVGVLRHAAEPARAVTVEEGGAESPGLARTLAWLGLSACASVLLLATTNQLSQDVSAGPFVWVLPLALYLVTFIIAFEREALYSRPLTALLLLLAVGGVTRITYEGAHVPLFVQLLVHSTALFSGALLCHGELYRLRPAPRHLGAFYLWVSAGGVLGAALVHLAAPRVFSLYLEYPLTLGVCCFMAALILLRRAPDETIARASLRYVPALLLLLVAGGLGMAVSDERRVVESWRGFFGVVQVTEPLSREDEEHAFVLRHGDIVHGFQYTRPERRMRPTAYYTSESGLGLALTEKRRLKEAAGLPPSLRVGVLGLGVGTTAALGRSGDTLRFYEIDPQIISLARGTGGYFSYLSDTPARVEVLEGDARILLEQELARGQAQGFDVLAVDVFSSDSIPVHLLTEEAVDVYRRHLAPGGVLALHISNVHLDLLPVAVAHAWFSGMHATLVATETNGDARGSSWVLMDKEGRFTRGETFSREGERVRRLAYAEAPRKRWTDERSSLLPFLRALGVDRGGLVEEPTVEPAPVAAPAGP
ncbi:spermidine synthase [Archangium lipolyticum]|uniref:spermidine synthase n=1 Tax=Archangium lipolyticum TaxID=2970465 RepID=UPI00214A0C7A|nr:fused MFS/spermidine synthase [Archangium lipolyticum]